MPYINAQDDGSGLLYKGDLVWLTAHNPPATCSYDLGVDNIEVGASFGIPANYYRVGRGLLAFDTSTLSSVSWAKVRLHINRISVPHHENIEVDSGYATLYLTEGVQHTGPGRAGFAHTDFIAMIAKTVSGGSKALSGLTAPSWLEIDLNATGESWLNFGGLTLFGLRVAADININIPSGTNRWEFQVGTPQLLYPAVPTVLTNPATDISIQGSVLNGKLWDDGDEDCICGFEWGLTEAYGYITPTVSKTKYQVFDYPIAGLSANTTYHFRAFGINAEGTGYGADTIFTTGAGGYVGSEPIVTLEALRNVEMAGQGRLYIDNDGKAKYESRFHRSL